MNPALPLLALLTAGGAVALAGARRRPGFADLALPWALAGLAGMALLAPALALPDGIPSPAATLAHLPPWQGTGAPEEGNPLLRDVTFQIQPWLLFLRGELREGRLPLWNPHQFAGTPFWANGQSAPLFPLHLLFAALPLGVGFVLLPWLRVLVAGCGAWALARALGLARPGAALAAVVFPLSGMLVSFVLFPMGNALALVPWVLWAVERLAAGRGAAPLALLAGAQLLAGHPETSIHTAILSALYLLVRGAARPLRAWLLWAAAWAAAAALAAVHLLPFALLLPATSKWQAAGTADLPSLALRLTQPLRLVLPQLYGHPALGTWWGPFNYSATAVYAGAAALPLAAAALPRLRGDRRWLAVAVLLVFSLLAAYHLPGMHELLSIPPLGKVAHHRLLFGVELTLALLAGAGCDRWLAGPSRSLASGAALVAVLLAVAWLLFRDDWAVAGLLRQQALWTLTAAGVALLLTASLALSPARRWWLFPPLLAVMLLDLLAAHARIPGRLSLARLYPETPAVRFLAARPGRVAGLGESLRPNAATVHALADVRGDDPVKLARYERLYARLSRPDPVYSQPIERWTDPLLDRLGVRWVLGPPSSEAPVPAWRPAYDGPDARIWQRPTALPLVRWEDGDGREDQAGLTVVAQTPGRWEVTWRSTRPRTLIVAEVFAPGWQASTGGRTVEVVSADDLLLGIPLPAGEGHLTLRYRAPGLVSGALLSLAALCSSLLWLFRERRKLRWEEAGEDSAPSSRAEPPSPLAEATEPRSASSCLTAPSSASSCSCLSSSPESPESWRRVAGPPAGGDPGARPVRRATPSRSCGAKRSASRPPLRPTTGTAKRRDCEPPEGGPATRHDRSRAGLLLLLLLLPVFLFPGCTSSEPNGFLLHDLVSTDDQSALTFQSPPRRADIEIDQERRPAVLTTAEGFTWRGRIPPDARLTTGFAVVPAAWRPGTAIEVSVEADDGSSREVVEVARTPAADAQRWGQLAADLSRHAGREIALTFRARITAPTGAPLPRAQVAWAPVAVTTGPHPKEPNPNIVFILVDTLRRDRLQAYGYTRPTSPEIQRLLADRGTVVEEAYAQAPWTLPSLVAIMSGRNPGEVVQEGDPAGYSLPAGIPTLAERLRARGYRTAGFYANPTLHRGNGFARGFDTFYTSPPVIESMNLHADDVTGRALPWLAAHRDRPFFLYVHYIDPHDPYHNPDVVAGRSPFLPGYEGPVAGNWVHGFYTGQLQLPDRERDLPHVNALYDSEVRYVDRFVGRLLAGLGPAAADTLIVLTSDHGEEMLDHGGWKHGQTLYEEQIHVPLIVRWDGRIEAGRRLPGTVRLLDLLPTLVGAAGGDVEPECDGVDLLPALLGTGPLPRRPAFAQHLSSGPWRAAAVTDGEKLVFFNREAPFQPADALQEHFWRLDLGRLERAELYDLARDPEERRSLAAARPERVAALAPVVHRQLDRQLPGLRLWVPAAAGAALPEGARLGGSIRFERPPAGWFPYLTAAEDRVEVAGDTLRFDLAVERLAKGVVIAGEPGAVEALDLRLDGRPVASGRVWLGAGRAWAGGRIPAPALVARDWPPGLAAGRAALLLWRPAAAPGAEARGASDPETERRLRALGYIQ